MFDKYYLNSFRSSPQTVNVTEKRAPTDESVRLLREMEKEAQDSVISSIKVDTNTLKGVVVLSQSVSFAPSKKLYIRFNFNGRDYQFEEDVEDARFALDPPTAFRILARSVRDKIFDSLIDKMASELVG